MTNAWRNFQTSNWSKSINVREFIQSNFTLYEGDESFLVDATDNTKALWAEVTKLYDLEIKNGILDAETKVASNH